MANVRILTASGQSLLAECSRCLATGCPWDRIGEKPICPDCQEMLARGEGEPLIERLVPQHCAICNRKGTVRYLTFPLHARDPLAIDLCPRHFQALLGRRLEPADYRRLCRALQGVGLSRKHIFLLHEAFYDDAGRALQPVGDE